MQVRRGVVSIRSVVGSMVCLLDQPCKVKPMPLKPEQVEQEIEQLRKLCQDLSERVVHLQKRVTALEEAVYEGEAEPEQPRE